MPNRIIKESVKRSPEIDRLSWFEEVVFYRLIVTADDYGRLDGRPVVLKNDLFPTKDTITRKAIEDAMGKLVSVGLLIPYVDAESGMPYYYFPTWQDHQRVRDSKKKYPDPPQLAATRRKLPQIAANCGLESESESESESNPKDCRACLKDAFDVFWTAYPRKTGKQDAFKAFQKLKPDGTLMQIILSAIEKQKQSAQWTKDGVQFIPHPATWLNGSRWEDEMPKCTGKTVTAQNYTQREYSEADLSGFGDLLKDAEARKTG